MPQGLARTLRHRVEQSKKPSVVEADAAPHAGAVARARGIGVGLLAALALLAALGVSWATRGSGSTFGFIEWAAVFVTTLARSAWASAAYLLSGLGMGWWIRRFIVRELSPTLAACVGLSVLLTLSHLLGVLGVLGWFAGSAVGWLLIGFGLVGLALDWRSIRASAREARVAVWHAPAAVLALGVMIAAVLAPPGWLWRSEFGGYDVLSYHLQLVQEWLAGGRVWPVEHNVYSFHPSYMEAAYYHLAVLTAAPAPTPGDGPAEAWGLCAGDGWRLLAPQMLHAGLAVMAAVLIAELTRRVVERAGLNGARTSDAREIGQGTATMFLATPWIVVVGTLAYNEMGMMVMFAGAMLAAAESGVRPWVRGLLVGWLVGVACGCKATALLLVGTPVGIALAMWSPRREWARVFAAAALAGVAALLPWLIRNWLACGNPVFPALSGVFGRGHWSSEQVARFTRAHTFTGGWGERLAMLLRRDASDPVAPTHRGLAHPQWFIFFIVAIASCVAVSITRRTRRVGLAIAIGVTLQLAVWLLATHVQSRFLIPLAFGGSVAAGLCASACGTWGTWGACGRRVLAAAALAQVLALGALYWKERDGAASALTPIGPPMFTGELAQEAWREGDSATRSAILEQASPEVFCGLVLAQESAGARMLLVGGATPLYFAVPTAYSTTWDTSELSRVMAEAPDEPMQWSRRLVARGFTHVLVDQAELDRLARSGFLDQRLDAAERGETGGRGGRGGAVLAQWLRTLKPMRVWATGQVLADIRSVGEANQAPPEKAAR